MATYKLHLESAGPNVIKVIRVVQEITGLGLKAAKELVNSAPCVIKEGYTDKSTAEADMKKLTTEDAEAYVETIGLETVSGYSFSILLADNFDDDNSPVAYATVKLYTGENGQFITSGKTNTEGKFIYSTSSSNSDYIGAPNYAIIEKLRFISINKTLQWQTVFSSSTENTYALSKSHYFNIYMEPKGFIYFKPKYYDKSDFKVKDFTGTLLLQCYDARTGKNTTSSMTISSAITQDADGYYYPTTKESYPYHFLLYRGIDQGLVYFVLTTTDQRVVQGGSALPTIYFYPYGIFNSTEATDYNLNSRLTFYPSQKALRISDLRQCYVSEYRHLFPKPNSNNEYYKSTFCPTTITIAQNYYQPSAYYDNKLPYSERLRPYSVALLKIVLCVYENETYMYNSNTPTQYGGATVTVQYNGASSTYNSISALTSAYTSVTTSSIYFTSKVKITLSNIVSGLTFEKEKEEFYFIPGMTEIQFNAYKQTSTANPHRTIVIKGARSIMKNNVQAAELLLVCKEGPFTSDVALVCSWYTTDGELRDFLFTVHGGESQWVAPIGDGSNDLDYAYPDWQLDYAAPSQAIADKYSRYIEPYDKGTCQVLYAFSSTKVPTDITVYVNGMNSSTNNTNPSDIEFLLLVENHSEAYTIPAWKRSITIPNQPSKNVRIDLRTKEDAFYRYTTN